MKKVVVLLAAFLVLFGIAAPASASPGESVNFVAVLSGGEEVPARDTQARGNASFHLSADGSELDYKLIVANIENVVAAHIHCGAPGVNASVGVTLFSGGLPGSGRVDGILSQGTKTAPDAGNLCGWTSLADAVAAMRSGNAYVNVHTNDGNPATSNIPGDFPGGEIRGDVMEAGPSN